MQDPRAYHMPAPSQSPRKEQHPDQTEPWLSLRFLVRTQLLTTAFNLFNSFEREKQTDVAILDFSKAFDTVPHKKLLHKLSLYGITGPLHAWLSNFLTQRSMRVVIEGACSKSTTVDSGVPQGTVLGPILFLCHINDLPSSVSSQVRLFADDCLLYREINTFKDHLTLQQDLKQLEVWADTWGMRFNASKCYILSIKEKSNFHYTLNSTILKHVTNNPYLGILFSQDLKWGDHIAKICKKANSIVGFLRRNLRNCPSGCKRNAYLSLVRSVLEYGATLWDPHLHKDINKLEQVQRKAARFVSGDYKYCTPGSMQKLLRKLDLSPLQVRRQQLRLTFLFKVVEGLVPAMPPEHLFTFSKAGRKIRPKRNSSFETSNIVNRYTRNNNRSLEIKPCRTSQQRNSIFIRTAVEWNHLDDSTVNLKTTAAFKAKIEENAYHHQPVG